MSLSPPVQITVPFATGGLKNTIPANANPTDGHAGYDVGFPAINMTPKTAGGIPPFGQDFNGIFFEISTAIQYLEAGGSFPYSSTFSTAVGGYPLGAIVSRTDGTGLWRNVVSNNTTNPETFGAGWQPEDAGNTPVTMTNANVTLTALQAARSIIVITGVLTANLNLVFPAYTKQWLVINNCTGAFTVTVKTASGSGVIIPAGSRAIVYGDGTNISSSQSNALTTFSGLVQLATNAQMAAGTDASLVPPVSAVMSLFAKRTFALNDFIRIPDVPGGMIIQWGRTPTIAAAGTLVVTLPTPFPNFSATAVCMAEYSSAPNTGYVISIFGRTLTNLSFYNSNTGVANTATWIAIGN